VLHLRLLSSGALDWLGISSSFPGTVRSIPLEDMAWRRSRLHARSRNQSRRSWRRLFMSLAGTWRYDELHDCDACNVRRAARRLQSDLRRSDPPLTAGVRALTN